MAYVQGFVVPVPATKKENYRKMASGAWPLFKEFGATRLMEAWGDDVPDGKVTDFKGAVKAQDGEVVVFSWFEFPDKKTYQSASEKMMNDPRMKEMGSEMPFDGQRMIYGGFEELVDIRDGKSKPGYVEGAVIPVPANNQDAYRKLATERAQMLKENGATRVVDAWGDDVPDGKVTDFKGAVKAEEGEKVVFAWIEWPSKETREAGWKKVMEDPRMQAQFSNMPFDGKRMIYGGFAPIVDE